MSPLALLFDLDGTLWDARAIVSQARNRVIDELGLELPRFTPDDIGKTMGLPATEVYHRAFPMLGDDHYAEVRKILDAEMRTALFAGHAHLYPGVRETLRLLAPKHGLFVVSNCSSQYLKNFLEWSRIGELTDSICFGDTQLSKDENILRIIDRHGLTRSIYLGDTQGDRDAASKAGILYIHADYGFGKVEDPCPRIASFAELPERFATLL